MRRCSRKAECGSGQNHMWPRCDRTLTDDQLFDFKVRDDRQAGGDSISQKQAREITNTKRKPLVSLQLFISRKITGGETNGGINLSRGKLIQAVPGADWRRCSTYSSFRFLFPQSKRKHNYPTQTRKSVMKLIVKEIKSMKTRLDTSHDSRNTQMIKS